MKAAGQYEPNISDNESGVTVLAKAVIEHASLQYKYTNSNPLTFNERGSLGGRIKTAVGN